MRRFARARRLRATLGLISSRGGACWQFTSAVAPERAARLLSWRSFDEIVESLATCHIAPLYWEPATKLDLNGCYRASFVLTVLPDLYDAFFNAPVGYRGQFAKSETLGEAANRKIIEALLSRLLEVATRHPTATRQFLTTSLQGKQAKIWIDETAVDHELTEPHSSIDYPDWEFNDPNGQGLRAPRGTKLEVKGGWVGATGKEVVNPDKNNRSRNINRTGYSG